MPEAPLHTPPRPEHHRRRRRAGLRSLGIASAAAFAGGLAVVGVQITLNMVSAAYPPVIESLSCTPTGEGAQASGMTVGEEGVLGTPVLRVAHGAVLECRVDAPGADYAVWRMAGPTMGVRSGPIDPSLPCQSPQDFAGQEAGGLRLATCMRLHTDRPGLHLLTVQVMARGQQAVDRSLLALRVLPPQAAAPADTRIQAVLRVPASTTEQTREGDLAASFAEHGMLAQSRAFQRTVLRLEENEEFVSAEFRARSASHASDVRLSYVPATRAVVASFTLRSGPILDRWRGWVSGTVVVRVRRAEEARDVALAEAGLPVPGMASLPLPEGVEATGAHVILRRPETGHSAELAAGGATILDHARIAVAVEGNALVLRASRP